MVYPMAYDDGESHTCNSSVVDCTLSLGTPATRLTGDHYESRVLHETRPNWSNNICWDTLQSSPNNKPNTPDSFLMLRRCANCDTTSTPLWRNGPRGPKVNIYLILTFFFIFLYKIHLQCMMYSM